MIAFDRNSNRRFSHPTTLLFSNDYSAGLLGRSSTTPEFAISTEDFPALPGGPGGPGGGVGGAPGGDIPEMMANTRSVSGPPLLPSHGQSAGGNVSSNRGFGGMMGGRKNDGDMGIVDVGSFSAFGQSPDQAQQASRSDASASSEGKGKGGDGEGSSRGPSDSDKADPHRYGSVPRAIIATSTVITGPASLTGVSNFTGTAGLGVSPILPPTFWLFLTIPRALSGLSAFHS